MKAAVWHVLPERYSKFLADQKENIWPLDYTLAATLETDDVEDAYQRTNSIDGPWYLNLGVNATGNSLRSTSVGDVIEIIDWVSGEYKQTIVENVGYKIVHTRRIHG